MGADGDRLYSRHFVRVRRDQLPGLLDFAEAMAAKAAGATSQGEFDHTWFSEFLFVVIATFTKKHFF